MLIPRVGIVLYVLALIVWCVLYYAVFGVMYDFFSKKADKIMAEKRVDEAAKTAEALAEEMVDEVKTEA